METARAASTELVVVGIGASSGGLDACRRLLSDVPPTSGYAFVIVMHLSPSHESHLAELLQPSTSMPVHQAEHGQVLEADHVYVIPPDAALALAGGKLVVSPMDGARGHVVDRLFASLATELGARAVAVVLSGSGSDGAEGVAQVRRAGGFVIAQQPDTAEQSGMPESAIASGCVDRVLPLEGIPRALLELAQQHGLEGEEAEPEPKPKQAAELAAILDVLSERYGVEFRDYKTGTLTRRTERRVAALGVSNWREYLELLRSSPEEVAHLFDDILIGVTSFFRDQDVWKAFEATAAPRLLDEHDPAKPLRVWVPACARGEEAYTIAMILLDLMAARGARFPLQVFGTDLNADAIAAARHGLYPSSTVTQVSPDRLERFFRKQDDAFRVSRELRETLTFSVHNVLADPPFAKLD